MSPTRKVAIQELTQRVWFDDARRLVPVAFFDYEALDDPRIDERAIVLERTRRQLIAAMKKNGAGRRGLPRDCVLFMYEDYKRVGSLSKVARLYRRTRQSMWDLFKRRHLPMNERKFGARILFDGKVWTPMKGGYFRETISREKRRLLHHVIWEKRTGRRIAKGYQVTFANGDSTDFSSRNLLCLPIAEVSLLHYRRRFRERAHLTATERREWWKEHYRSYAARRSADWVAKGLRSDGKPRKRLAVGDRTGAA